MSFVVTGLPSQDASTHQGGTGINLREMLHGDDALARQHDFRTFVEDERGGWGQRGTGTHRWTCGLPRRERPLLGRLWTVNEQADEAEGPGKQEDRETHFILLSRVGVEPESRRAECRDDHSQS